MIRKDDLLKELLVLFKKYGIEIEEAIQYLKELGTKAVLAAWGYTEIECQQYTFKELMKWIQDNFNQNKHSAASVTKEMQDGKIILKCCFLNKNKEPLAEIGDLFLKVKTDSICDDLKNNFGNKDMIIIE